MAHLNSCTSIDGNSDDRSVWVDDLGAEVYEDNILSEEDSWHLFEEWVLSMGMLLQSDSFDEIYPELRQLKVPVEDEDMLFY